ncbi:MAG: hypothetical protein K9I36_09130 [Bacteroidia bacterium]|nr:hypothetical protein [Bacteroidia bacterium]MCF8426881.1 hypothetical protein [Bacteroidia bacterium]
MITTYKYLTPVSIERTRYFTDPAFDTIKFKSNKGDTLIFVKTDCDSVWFDEYKSWNNPACGPYENVKNLQITNTYKTIKGEGIFKVKHSVRAKLLIDLNAQDYVIEIMFLGNHFYFFEETFYDNTYEHYIGDTAVGDTIFSNSFFEYSNFDIESKVIGVMVPNLGIITIRDSLNLVYFELIK